MRPDLRTAVAAAASSESGEMAALRADHAAEADVAGRGVDRLALARRRPVAEAVVGRAQMRAALDHASLDAGSGGRRRRAARRAGSAELEAVRRPLPHVAGHVVQAVAV